MTFGSSMQAWQWLSVVAVAAACVTAMSLVVARMFSRRSDVGVSREGTAFESGLADAERPQGTTAFDAFSYRVSARFAGRVRVVVGGETVVVAGPRTPPRLYRAWIWLQALVLALVPAALVWAVVSWDWHPLCWAVALFVTSWLVSTVGAAVWPALGETAIMDDASLPAVEYPREAVHTIKTGPGWSDGGLEWVLLPYKKGIDALAGVRAVSWFAPDGDGHEVRYAVHLYSDEQAEKLARVLRGE